MRSRSHRRIFLLAAGLSALAGFAQSLPQVTSPKSFLGFNLGDDYMVANYSQLEAYWKKLASESDRMKLVDIGKTEEGRDQWMAIISSPANIQELDRYKRISQRLAHAEGVTEAEAHQLAAEGKAVVWIDGGLHASESVGSQQLMEMVYQMVSRTDPDTMRFLNDVILLCVQANPDGQELIANWYMHGNEKGSGPLLEPDKRTMNNLPRLWAKYAGHDDNRDFYMSNMKETTNMNRQMFIEWFPQIVYDHHQTGPAGAVIFMPPFRDPFNYNLDPLIPLGIEMVGTAMHAGLVAEGKGGSAMRSGASYSTWWNGGLRTITYFHNMIGILTEIIGNPAPMNVSLVPDKQLPKSDWPLPVAPGTWHYRQSIDYEITNNRSILDLASRYRSTFLLNIWRMGMNSIEKGSRDYWTITPKRIEALQAATVGAGFTGGAPLPGPRLQPPFGDRAPSSDGPPTGSAGGRSAAALSPDLYNSVLHDPKMRDARGYILPSDQPDFANATEFLNTLIKNGITCLRATAAFQAAGKSYAAGSYVVKTAQAFRPHIRDMFEPQDHPNDFAYPGGPPNRPYDITGWTLAMQMGVEYDRVFDGFDGPFEVIHDVLPAPERSLTGAANPAGYLISHQINNSFIVVNRILKAGGEVYWLKGEQMVDGKSLGSGAIWIPATITGAGIPAPSASVRPLLDQAAKELGVPVYALAQRPGGEALKLRSIRVGLYDSYGGSMPSGWTRWLFEQYEVPFQLVYPPALDAGELHRKFDVLVFPSGTFGLDRGGGAAAAPEYRDRAGRITRETTIPQLKKFVEQGGTIVFVGSGSNNAAASFGLPIRNYLTEIAGGGSERDLPSEKFYVPGSLLRINVDRANPIAYGMPKQVDVFFENDPVFKLSPNATAQHTSAVAWFAGSDVLDSGWAWGQQHLDGGTAVAEAVLGEGRIVLLGPEVNFRDQSHATYKLLFNSLYYGAAKGAPVQ